MKQRILTLKDAWQEGREALMAAGIEEAPLDAWYLLSHVTGISKAVYYANPERKLTEEETAVYGSLIKKRAERIPLQHLTGEQEFMGFTFRVNEHVLIPRQDTETLVECALSKLRPGMHVLDMCTGSGCIIISLKKLGEASGKLHGRESFTAVDISKEAIQTAKENAADNLADIRFVHSNLFARAEGRYDLIVSNPPYIKTSVIKELQTEVRCFDPYIALDGREDGLHFYREIINQSISYIAPGGWLLFEIGCDQAAAVSELMQKCGYEKISVKKDLAGLDRVVMGMYNEE